jgi:hypothetical protein
MAPAAEESPEPMTVAAPVILEAPVVAAMPPLTEALPAPAPAPAPEAAQGAGLGLENCIELRPGYLSLHWEVTDGVIVLGLEGRSGGNNRWLGFGFSQPGAADVVMTGSDAVVGE